MVRASIKRVVRDNVDRDGAEAVVEVNGTTGSESLSHAGHQLMRLLMHDILQQEYILARKERVERGPLYTVHLRAWGREGRVLCAESSIEQGALAERRADKVDLVAGGRITQVNLVGGDANDRTYSVDPRESLGL